MLCGASELPSVEQGQDAGSLVSLEEGWEPLVLGPRRRH